MSALTFQGAGYRYPSGEEPAVQGVDLAVESGQLVLLTGPTGCGKSTLIRLAAGLLGRHGGGDVLGSVEVQGEDPARLTPADRARQLGFVSQTPDRQLLTATTGDEIAFPLESVGAPGIASRVTQQLAQFGLPGEHTRSTQALSGGQKQRLVTASAMAAGAGLLLLDEPLAQLDPAGAAALMARLRGVADAGVAVVVVEHRLSATLPLVDRVLVMDGGRIVADSSPAQVDAELLGRLGMRLPGTSPERNASVPLEEGDARESSDEERRVLLEAGPLRHRYREADQDALDIAGLTLRAGERVALLGANGSGKSTLIGALAGEHDAGAVQSRGRVLDLPQDPDLALFSATVREELAHGAKEQRLGDRAVQGRVAAAAAATSVQDLLDRSPHALSRGQRLRVAVAAMLACEPDIVLLDEPTSGQDHGHVERMMLALRSEERALLFATHDEALAQRHATRVLRMEAGRFVAHGEVRGDAAPAHDEAAAGAASAIPGSMPRSAPRGGLDPRVRIALLICVGVLAVVLSRASSLATLALLCAFPLLLVGVPRRWLLRGGLGLLAIVWSTVLSQGLFYAELPRVPLVRAGPLVIWTEGVLWGLVQSLRFVSTLLAGLALVISTSPDRLYSALLRLRIPYGLAFLSSMALRTVPETARSALIVRRARARRGRSLWARSPWAWLRLEVEMLRPVVAESLRRARSLAEALDSRGFDPLVPRTERHPSRIGVGGWGLLGTAVVVTATLAAGRILFVLYSAEVLYLPALRPLYGWVRAWL
ncbi:MAG: ATP-binding cassette domain-containing protein [Deltaproteobacteria bacterium]|nr:ATP-binding cassette domain-containing protein [Deltaproteobacteria bacterium]